jgi:hypothetical protein
MEFFNQKNCRFFGAAASTEAVEMGVENPDLQRAKTVAVAELAPCLKKKSRRIWLLFSSVYSRNAISVRPGFFRT